MAVQSSNTIFNLDEILEEVGITPERPRMKSGRRSPTMLKLQWLAERVRKCERIKTEIAEGRYSVDSQKVARSILNLQDDSEK
ncbi:MAG: flagellar biosynthesis anti-sigma factor FlgM [Deltaproteobacteria bacterium]|nr:flagellar biosynthesis anti-sigma factor FlgM [Deltaproteobacteria bacterium]